MLRPATPSKLSQPIGLGSGPSRLNSPPQTPKSASPAPGQLKNRKGNWGARSRQSKQQQAIRDQLSFNPYQDELMDDGPVYGYRPGVPRPEQSSPRSPFSSSDGDDECSNFDSTTSDSPPRSVSSKKSSGSNMSPPPKSPARQPPPQPNQKTHPSPPFVTHIVVEATFELVELEGSDYDDCEVIRPDYIEYPDSEGSHSRPLPAPLDRKVVNGMRNLVFESSDESDMEETEHERKMREQREEKRRKRMSSGSISKRTVSERGSGTDSEDLASNPDPHDSAHRRMRRRLGIRRSLLFQDPPPPRIDEADEPDSSEEILDFNELLARELPFYDYVTMEIDSP